MKKLEKTLIVLIVMSFIMRVLVLPFGTTLFVFSSGSLALVYAYFGFALFNGVGFKEIFKKGSFKGVGAWLILLAIFAGLVLSVTVVGIEFRLMQWPNSKVLLGGGLIGLLLVFVFALIARAKGNTPLFKRISQRAVPFLAVALICFFLSNDTIRHFRFHRGENGFERVDPEKIDRRYEERGGFE
ncbi:hypothetical protein [Halocola ammonii]